MCPVRVLVIDDSAFMRQIISKMLEADQELCVVGVARDGEDAMVKLDQLTPDVVTLDLEMPKMDGLDFLSKVMGKHPLPVVVVSSWARAGAEKTIRALELGAIDFITKPVAMPSEAMLEIAEELVNKVKTAALAKIPIEGEERKGPAKLPPSVRGIATNAAVCCIAASTGGPRALQSIVTRLPGTFPLPILLVQHMPVGFTRVFADRMTEIAKLPVREGSDGDPLHQGEVLVARAGMQTKVIGGPGHLRLKVSPNPPSVFRPSADVTFNSIADACGAKSLGVILTGMGQDGARGLLAMRKAGAPTIAESSETCVVYGMPRVASEMGAVQLVLPLWDIPEAIMSMASAD